MYTYEPHMNDARPGPLCIIIQMDTFVFSPPRSPLTRDGVPYSWIASMNTSKTVCALLFVLAFSCTTLIQELTSFSMLRQIGGLLFDNIHQ